MMKRKTVAVIGLGMFGIGLVKHLKMLNAEVIAIDKDSSKVLIVGEVADRSFICDGGNVKALEELGIDKVDHAIVAMSQGNSNAVVSTITTTIALKKLGVKNIIVRLDDEGYKEILEEIGATSFFSPFNMASEKLANIVLADNYEDYFNISDEYSILQIEVSDNFKEQTLIELNTTKNYGVIVVLIKRDGREFMPKAGDTIKASDQIFVFGAIDDAQRLAGDLAK